ncbi:MAG: permease [Firmicutes bacterium]|nr:permease [Bacillota bacterium]
MKDFLRRYRFALATLLALAVLGVFNLNLGKKAAATIGYSLREMLLVIPPIFILIGLLDVWVPKETMIRLMGKGSGLRGAVLAVLLGSVAAGPLYAAFPVAAVLAKKGASFRNVVILLGAWSTTKIPMFLFEITALGGRFALTRLVLNLPGIVLIGAALEKIIGPEEEKRIMESLVSL